MPLHIVNAEADRLAREIAQVTHESLSAVVVGALREHAERLRAAATAVPDLAEMRAIAARSAHKCAGDGRTLDELVGYDDQGLPG